MHARSLWSRINLRDQSPPPLLSAASRPTATAAWPALGPPPNGEFHTFVHDGPGLARPIDLSHGTTVQRDGFFFHDLLPKEALEAS